MIPISRPKLYREDKQLILKAVSEGNIANGPQIKEFETKFAEYCNRKYAVTCSNGTAGLYLALKALKLPKNSEVIIPTLTIVSCLSAVELNKLKPVYCDSDLKTWNLSFKSLRSKITANTSAIMLVNTYGLLVDVEELTKLKKDYPHIKIIEDASESHGATYKDVCAGSLGDVSVFSLYANKIVTAGEGGIVLTDSEEVYINLLQDRNLNFIDRKKYIHSEAGFNFRLTNLQACIGLGQLANISKTLKNRVRIAKQYNKHFKQYPEIQTPFVGKGYKNVYWYYTIVVKSKQPQMLKALEDNGIDYRHVFYPLHQQPFSQVQEKLPNSEYLHEHGIILPTYTELTNQQIDFIAQTILKTLE